MHITTNSETYEGTGEMLEITLKNTREEKTWQLCTFERLRQIFGYWENEAEELDEFRYEIKLVSSQSTQTHRGQVAVPPHHTVTVYCEYNVDGIEDLDYVLHNSKGKENPVSWLLGAFVFSRTRQSKGIGSGKLMAIYDNLSHTETREIEYLLLDEQLIVRMNATNPSKEKYRLRLTNSFIFAENFDLDITKDLVEICVMPKDIYRIEVIIKPSGEIITNCRRL